MRTHPDSPPLPSKSASAITMPYKRNESLESYQQTLEPLDPTLPKCERSREIYSINCEYIAVM